MVINLKEAKSILEFILDKIEKGNNKELQEDFKLILRFLYHNENLQRASNIWIQKIENKEISHEDILEMNKDIDNCSDIFYPVEYTHSNKYRYYVNNLGIMLVVETNKIEIKEYHYEKDSLKYSCWVVPIGNDGCLDNQKIKEKEFYNSNKKVLPVLIGHLSIYEQIKKTDLYKDKENYVAHHIVCNKYHDKTPKNDARDNRIENIISIPKELHLHKKLNDYEKEKAKNLYEKYSIERQKLLFGFEKY